MSQVNAELGYSSTQQISFTGTRLKQLTQSSSNNRSMSSMRSRTYLGNSAGFNYTGGEQYWGVPDYVEKVIVRVWASGGAGGYICGGGGGGFVEGYYTPNFSGTFQLSVAGDTRYSSQSPWTYGDSNGGHNPYNKGGGTWVTGSGGQGGGYSAVYAPDGSWMLAGGGGGGGDNNGGGYEGSCGGGGGGGWNGGYGQGNSNGSGGDYAVNSNGYGDNGFQRGGGGGGYYGGASNGGGFTGGGAGSSANSGNFYSVSFSGGNGGGWYEGQNPPGSTGADYPGYKIGYGGGHMSDGGNGYIVIKY
jgi:heterogeneous nuclear ribonucleoprotein A1/A3